MVVNSSLSIRSLIKEIVEGVDSGLVDLYLKSVCQVSCLLSLGIG